MVMLQHTTTVHAAPAQPLPWRTLTQCQAVGCGRGRRPPNTTTTKAATRSSRSSTTSSNDSTKTTTASQPVQLNLCSLLLRQAVALSAAGAVLGPFCDGLHSQHDVLHYVQPTVSLQLGSWSLETCWWVPLLFGLAGLIIGVSVPLLDELSQASSSTSSSSSSSSSSASASPSSAAAADQQQHPQASSWPPVLLCIGLFVTQYGLSGILEQPLLGQTLGGSGLPALDTLLAAYALALWGLLDATPQGFAMAAATAVCGPLIEVLLIDVAGLYNYSHGVWFDAAIPSWIPWVYFAGGPAVGNLGRRVWQTLKAQDRQQQRQQQR